MKVIFVLNETTQNPMCLCNFSVQIMYPWSFMFVEKHKHRTAACGWPWDSFWSESNSPESVKGSKNKVRTNKTKALSIHLPTASKLGACCWWKTVLFQGWGTGTGSWTLLCAPEQAAGKQMLLFGLSVKCKVEKKPLVLPCQERVCWSGINKSSRNYCLVLELNSNF